MPVAPFKMPGSGDGLNNDQLAFAHHVLDGKGQGEAWRLVYADRRKPVVDARRAGIEARKIMASKNVMRYIQECREELEARALWKRLDSVKTLAEIARSRQKFRDELIKYHGKMEHYKEQVALYEAGDLLVEPKEPEYPEIPAGTGDVIGAVKELNRMHGWDKMTIDHTSSDKSMSPPERVYYEIVEPGELDVDEED